MGPPRDCGPLYMNKIRNRIKVLDECIEKLQQLDMFHFAVAEINDDVYDKACTMMQSEEFKIDYELTANSQDSDIELDSPNFVPESAKELIKNNFVRKNRK